MKTNKSNLLQIQKKIEDAVEKNYDLYDLAHNAYKSYIRNYANSKLNIDNKRSADDLDVKNICFQFGFNVPLFVSIK